MSSEHLIFISCQICVTMVMLFHVLIMYNSHILVAGYTVSMTVTEHALLTCLSLDLCIQHVCVCFCVCVCVCVCLSVLKFFSVSNLNSGDKVHVVINSTMVTIHVIVPRNFCMHNCHIKYLIYNNCYIQYHCHTTRCLPYLLQCQIIAKPVTHSIMFTLHVTIPRVVYHTYCSTSMLLFTCCIFS